MRPGGIFEIDSIWRAHFFVFGVLAVIGVYPATAARHVTWANAIFIFLLANAADVLAVQVRSMRNRKSQFAVVGALTLAVLVALANPVRLLASPTHFTIEDNVAAISKLLTRREEAVGLAIGAQPVIEYYKKIYPDLNRFRYFGDINTASAPLPAWFNQQVFSRDDHDQVSARVGRDFFIA